jgi:hypothetical protein
MKQPLTISILLLALLACKENEKPQQASNKPSDLNLYLQTDVAVDSILICNITQEREFHFVPYSDTINITFNDSINDQYELNFFIGDNHVLSRLWLNGKDLVIKGRFNKKLEIDTVIGSDMYYRSLAFRKKYKDLQEKQTDSVAINNFLLAELNDHIKEPFSIEIANNFYYRNSKRDTELQKLYNILSTQDEAIKNHLVNPYKKIEKLLTVTKIDMAAFQFYDINKNLTPLKFSAGKKYLLDFWFLQCKPCLEDHKLIAVKNKSLQGKNIETISISIDQVHDEWKNFVQKQKYGWLHLREVDESAKRLITRMTIEDYPTYLMLDSEGKILYRSNSFEEVEKYLNL